MATVVLGAGAWGTALAQVAATKGERVVLWARDPVHADAIMRERENKRHLPDVPLAASIEAVSDVACVAHADLVLAAVPTQAFRNVVRAARSFAQAGVPWVICAKGIERESRCFLSDVLAEELPQVVPAVLSGPSFAADVARGSPTAVTVAAREERVGHEITRRLATPSFRLYRSTDIRGAEIGGAAKNVLAIACGITKGAGLGASAGAALIARGFAELGRFGRALDARPETLMGLSGLGDLVLTCSSEQSRNFSYGLALGRGEPAQAAAHGHLVEGAFTAPVLVELAHERAVDMPISQCVARVIAGELTIAEAIEALLQRPQKSE
ncbi:MAG: glycerol-3-phosphate dehydrogenase [Methylobacteriaceae bacterium]|jgi:glycerol-3-phosphate dehydrogenase (NAD(P)+)|nr:glycerol-3-phosphate dehydrogenase [Methylobacteriaceae bacterium]